jgi:hypothetical protein
MSTTGKDGFAYYWLITGGEKDRSQGLRKAQVSTVRWCDEEQPCSMIRATTWEVLWYRELPRIAGKLSRIAQLPIMTRLWGSLVTALVVWLLNQWSK